MADSKKPADQGLDQSDDLIAELARIVADDAKRASVSQSIEQRAQQERPVEQSRPAASSSGQTGAAPMSAFSGQQDRQQQNQQQRQEPTFSAPSEPKQAETEKAADPFEFDFASSYRESAAAQSTQSTAQDTLDRIEKRKMILALKLSSWWLKLSKSNAPNRLPLKRKHANSANQQKH